MTPGAGSMWTHDGWLWWVLIVLAVLISPFLLLFVAKLLGYGFEAGKQNYHKRRKSNGSGH